LCFQHDDERLKKVRDERLKKMHPVVNCRICERVDYSPNRVIHCDYIDTMSRMCDDCLPKAHKITPKHDCELNNLQQSSKKGIDKINDDVVEKPRSIIKKTNNIMETSEQDSEPILESKYNRKDKPKSNISSTLLKPEKEGVQVNSKVQLKKIRDKLKNERNKFKKKESLKKHSTTKLDAVMKNNNNTIALEPDQKVEEELLTLTMLVKQLQEQPWRVYTWSAKMRSCVIEASESEIGEIVSSKKIAAEMQRICQREQQQSIDTLCHESKLITRNTKDGMYLYITN
jgi:hypothetical protein